MEGRYIRPVSGAARVALFLAKLSLAVFLVAGLSLRQGLMDTPGFLASAGLVVVLDVTALVLGGIAIWRLWDKGMKGGRAAAAAIIVALAVAAPFIWAGWRVVTLPVLNDISTDVDVPPEFSMLARMRTTGQNAVAPITPEMAAEQAAAFPAVSGRRYDAAPDRVMTAISNVIAAEGWTIVGATGTPGEGGDVLIEARAHTLILGFPNDVAIRLSDEGETTYVDMRSASVYGRHDLGDNAARIEHFMKALDDEMVALASA